MRFIFLTTIFFILLVLSIVGWQNEIMTLFGKNWPPSVQSPLQRDTLRAIQNIYKVNDSKKPATFILGASFAAPFWDASRGLPDDERDNIYPLISGSEVLPDWIRLVENINVKGSTIILNIAPYKFANMWYDRAMIETHYIYGMAGKFLLPSKNFDNLWNKYKKNVNVDESIWNHKHWRMFQPTMPYVYYMNDLIDENTKLIINKIKIFLKNEKQNKVINDAQEYFQFDSIKIAENKKNSASIVIKNTNFLRAKDDYLKHISDFKLEQFRVWRDFSKTQFDESVTQSFKMLDDVIELAREKSLNIIVAESPVADIQDKELMPFLKDYENKLTALINKNIEKKDFQVLRFNRSKFDNRQEFFDDYVHINEAGYRYYEDYFQSVFKLNRKRIPEKKNIPLSWNKKNMVSLYSDTWLRRDILNSLEKKGTLFFKEGITSDINISNNLKITYEPFIDIFKSKPKEIKKIVFDETFTPGDLIQIDNNLKKYKSYEYINAEIKTKTLDFTRLDLYWSKYKKTNSEIDWFSNNPIFPTPFSWAFSKEDKIFIEKNLDTNFNEIEPGIMWTEVMNIPIAKAADKFSLRYHKNIKSIKVLKQKVDRLFYKSNSLKRKDSMVEFELPAVNYDETGGKIAHSGIQFDLHDIDYLFYIDSKHKIHQVNSNFKQRFGSFLPHTFGIKLSNGEYKTISFYDSKLIDLNFNKKKKILTFEVYDYHAHENFSFGYDLTPSKVTLDNGKLDSYRHYRNHGITDFLEDRKLSVSISNSSELIFPLWQREGRKATLVFVEHADYQETSTDPYIMYGNKEHKLIKGEGILGNNIPFTKTVFLTGDPLTFPVNIGKGKLLNFTQPTYLGDNFFAQDLKKYHETGLIEIALHQSGTTPYGNLQKSPSEAFEILKSEFQGRVWTDHGSMPSNISFNGWDPRQEQYYVLDDLANFSIDYLWAGPDKIAQEVLVGKKKLFDINMIRDNSSNSLLYELPMLKISADSAWMPTFFRTIEAYIPTKGDIKLLIENRGISLLHIYMATPALKALNYYDKGSEYKGVEINPMLNQWLLEIAKLRDDGVLNIETISDYLDYVKFVRKLKIYQLDNEDIAIESDAMMKDVSFAKVSFDSTISCLKRLNLCTNNEDNNNFELDVTVRYFTLDLIQGSQLLPPETL